jgi:hypothetical protein
VPGDPTVEQRQKVAGLYVNILSAFILMLLSQAKERAQSKAFKMQHSAKKKARQLSNE